MTVTVVVVIVGVVAFLVLWEWARGRDQIGLFRVTGLCPKCGEKINHFYDKYGLSCWHCSCGWQVHRWEDEA